MADETKHEGQLSSEEEITMLERKLEEKKRALEEQRRSVPEEKEVFREVMREHIERVRPQTPLITAPSYSPASPGATYTAPFRDDTAQKEQRESKIRSLVEYALTRTVEDAVKKAEAESPYLLDELHDHLVDDYYQKLLALRKIQNV